MRYLYLILALSAVACSNYKVKSSIDPKADVSQYKTWCWLNDCAPTFDGPDYIYEKPFMDDVVNAMAAEMQNKGYVQGDADSDLLLDFHVVLKEDSALSAIAHEEALPFWDQYEKDPYYHYLKGSLVIDIADREQGKIIWRSITESYLPEHPNMTYLDIQRGIKRALKDFPEKKKD